MRFYCISEWDMSEKLSQNILSLFNFRLAGRGLGLTATPPPLWSRKCIDNQRFSSGKAIKAIWQYDNLLLAKSGPNSDYLCGTEVYNTFLRLGYFTFVGKNALYCLTTDDTMSLFLPKCGLGQLAENSIFSNKCAKWYFPARKSS